MVLINVHLSQDLGGGVVSVDLPSSAQFVEVKAAALGKLRAAKKLPPGDDSIFVLSLQLDPTPLMENIPVSTAPGASKGVVEASLSKLSDAELEARKKANKNEKDEKSIDVNAESAKRLKVPDLNGMSSSDAADALLRSERAYVEQSLRVVIDMFVAFLKQAAVMGKPALSERYRSFVFQNIEEIYNLHRSFYQDLYKLRLKDSASFVEGLGALIRERAPQFKAYESYCLHVNGALTRLKGCLLRKKPFAEMMQVNQMCVPVDLRVLLLAPVTRLPQYVEYLAAVYIAMEDKESPAAAQLELAIRAMVSVTDAVAILIRDDQRKKLTLQVQDKIFDGNIALYEEKRFVIKRRADRKSVV